ncbi:heme exporter protein CcmB [Parasphingopyxis lamellibrachiae]|uniref:Heme exporter protein B n=1 Tax=Parasphingopyxis lamellibrachiae TaxID=680125 RepID=A0A3D9FIL2_9SPHN|nr:heme exporter protein CcmB [Parasphingopyxis lamellibrachiae]RED17478.1 heme exporter protein B [Parasphingopyxis lamellibrachiae]
MTAVFAIARRDLAQTYSGSGWLMPLVFFLLVATLFPFAIGPDPAILGRVGGGALWTAALLAALLPIDRLIAPDRDAGVLDQYAIRGISEEIVAVAKIGAHWIGFGPPLMLAALPASALLGMDADSLIRLELGLALGSIGLAALAVTVAALVAGLRSGGALAGLLMLPLAVPILIFGAGALDDLQRGAYFLLGASALLLLATAPFATGAAIRIMRE